MLTNADHRGLKHPLAPAALLLLALCLLASGAQALNSSTTTPSGYETPIAALPGDQVEPAVFGTRVVWEDWRHGTSDSHRADIYSYDTATHLELPEGVSTSDYGKILADDYDPAISSAGIFWAQAGFSDATITNEIHGRTLSGEAINTTFPDIPGWPIDWAYRDVSGLAADSGRLVFVVFGGTTYYLVLFEVDTTEYTVVRTTPNEIRSPAISGDTIVWQEYDGNDWNVLAQDRIRATPVAVANEPGDQVEPTVSGTRVVWADNRSGNWDLYTADLSQSNPVGSPWLVAPGDQRAPSLDGDRLAWQDDRGGDWDVWLGSLSGGDGAPIADAAGDQEAPAVHGDRVVWQDDRNGDWDVYMFTVSATGPAPVPTPRPLVITAPGTYSVPADGWDGETTPVEIRASDVVLDGGNHTLDGAGREGSCGVMVAGPVSNVVIRNLRLTNWGTGIRVENAADSSIEGCTVEHNRVGVALNETRSVTVSGNRVRANDDAGIWVGRSTDATVVDNDVTLTGDGFEHHLYTTMDLGTFAVGVSNSDRTVVDGNDLGGEYGSLDIAGSTATRVTGNQLTGRWVGILSLRQSDGAEVYDNIFRNLVHAYGAPENTTWNATPSPGPNIVGGPTIGGNFWAKPDGTGFSETHPDANGDGFIDTPFVNHDYGGGTDYLPLAAWSGPAPGPTPYRPLSIPGRIEAEDYDLGGFSDTTPGNAGGAYRADDVDIESAGDVTNVGWIRTGEHLAYTVNVTAAGTYTLTARVASPNAGRTIAVSVDGTPAGTLAVPNTGSFETWRTVSAPVTLAAGTHTLRLVFAGDGQNLDWLEFAPVGTAPGGTPFKPLAIPGTIQAEDYNLGGEGTAYHDTTPGNAGGAYRQDGVDIETAGGVTNVGWIRNGEWLQYTATVEQAGTYTMTARVASPNSGRSIAVSVDGAPVATVTVPNTGSFSAWRTVSIPLTLAVGSHTLRLAFAGDGQNLDWIAFARGGTVTTPTPTPTPEAGGASFTAAPVSAPKGSAVKFTVTPAAGKSIRSVWWSFDATAHLNTWNSRATNPTFFYPAKGTFSPLVKLTYADGSTETVQRTNYVTAT